jgi:hypothetical protein
MARSNMVRGKHDGIERAGYLMPSKDHKYEHLGKVIQRSPMPLPIRTYDLVTQFQRECCVTSNPDLFGCDADTGQYGMPPMSRLTEQALKDVIITSLITRTTGRVEHLRDYLEYTQDHNTKDDWQRMFKASDCRDLPLFIAASSATRDSSVAYLQSKSMTAWLSEQFKESLPSAVRASPQSYGLFLVAVEKCLDAFVRLLKGGILSSREGVVKKLCSILRGAGGHNKDKESHIMFIAHQMVADLEEVISMEGFPGKSPFEGEFVWAGYGGKQGFIALDHADVMGRECNGPGYRKWDNKHSPKLLMEACCKMKEHVEEELDDAHISLLGLKKTKNGRVVVSLTGKWLSLSDMEHMLCKVYLACSRSRGSRNHGASRAWRNFCWPSKRSDTVGAQHLLDTVKQSIIVTYERVISLPSLTGCGGLLALAHPFSDL